MESGTVTGRVLVVDDEADIRCLLQFKLEQAGYEVEMAEDGPAALSVTESWQPDVVVLDVGMPGMTGYDVCKKFRDTAGMRDVPVIMLTARTQATYSTLGYMAGADLYMTKPFSPRDLLTRIEEVRSQPRQGFGDELLNGPGPADADDDGAGRRSRWWRR